MRFRQQRVISNLDAEKNFVQAETEFDSQQAEIDAITASLVFGVPDTIEPDATAAEGVAATFARSDHRHAIAAAPASSITGTNAEGSSTSFARADHNHDLETPGCRVYSDTNVSIGNGGGGTAITFNQEHYDPFGMHSTSSNTSRITISKAGVYQVTGNIRTEANTTGVRALFLIVNGANKVAFNALTAVATDSGLSIMQVTTLWKFAASDYVEMFLFQTSGGALNVEPHGSYSPELAVHYVGAG